MIESLFQSWGCLTLEVELVHGSKKSFDGLMSIIDVLNVSLLDLLHGHGLLGEVLLSVDQMVEEWLTVVVFKDVASSHKANGNTGNTNISDEGEDSLSIELGCRVVLCVHINYI